MRRLSPARCVRGLACVAFALGVVWSGPSAAAPTVELTELPARLELPLPAGTNRLFAVKVEGKPSAVWLAASPDAEARLPLQPMAGKWVVNLGDPRLAAVVAGATQFQIFATVGDQTGGSLPVQFIAARKAGVSVELRDAEGTHLPGGGWVDPLKVGAVRVRWTGSGTRAAVFLAAGAVREKVEPTDGMVELKPAAILRDAWRAAGLLELIDGDGQRRIVARAIPIALDDTARRGFRVVQRRSLNVPGSRDYLTVHLGDISGTRVPVSLTGADGTVYFEQRLLAQGDRAEFALGPGRYVLIVEKLVNLMVGDDHAELRVEPATAAIEE